MPKAPARRAPSRRSAKSRDVRARIDAFNRGRRAELVERKYAAMREDPFKFFRGTAHLFWEDWSERAGRLDDAPLVWTSGDLHLENFGSYRGDNGLTYFDINDFDDAALAPATRDPARLLTSAYIAARALGLDTAATAELCAAFLDAYALALADGKARWIERATAKGMIRDLLDSAKVRTRANLLAARTRMRRGRRVIRIDDERAFSLSSDERKGVRECVRAFGASQARPLYYEVLDVAGRIAGLGSLGLRRYTVLVRGDAGPDGQRLLDVKEACPSSLTAHLDRRLKLAQPPWRNEADRVVHVQRRMQAIAPALLAAIRLEHGSFILRELQPRENRLTLAAWNGRASRIRKAVASMGHLTAWTQLRSSSRDGSARADDLIALANDRRMRRDQISFAREYADQTERDWQEFRDTV